MERDIINLAEQYTGKEIPLHDHEAFLMIFVEGENDEAIHRQANEIGSICLNNGAVDVFMPTDSRAKRNIAKFVETAHRMGEEHQIPTIALGHAGDGNVHLTLMGQARDEDEPTVKELLTKLCQGGGCVGGTIYG